MRILDISQTVRSGMPVWPGDPEVLLEPLSVAAGVAVARVSRLSMGTHTGTHVDAPRHVVPVGRTVEAIPLEALVGPVRVIPWECTRPVGAGDLEALDLPCDCTRLIVQFVHGAADAPVGPGFTLDAAEWLVRRGFLLVGTDSASVESCDDAALTVHRLLLQAGVVIVENLRLDAVTPGDYDLVCLPLKLLGADGAPARAILIDRGRVSDGTGGR